MKCLNDYLNDHNITLKDFCDVTHVSYDRMAKIRYGDTKNFNPTLEIVSRIFEKTKKVYGVGLTPWDYMSSLIKFYNNNKK